MKYSLGFSNFLEEISSLSHSVVFLYFFALIKDRNGMDLTEAEDIKNRWQEYTEELYDKSLLCLLHWQHQLGSQTYSKHSVSVNSNYY